MTITIAVGLLLYLAAGIAVATGMLVMEKATVQTPYDAGALLIAVIGWPILLLILLPVFLALKIRECAECRKPAARTDELD